MTFARHLMIAGDSSFQLWILPDGDTRRPRKHWQPVGAGLLACLLRDLKDAQGQPVHVHEPSLEHSDSVLQSIVEFKFSEHDPAVLQLKRQSQLDADPRWHSPISIPPVEKGTSHCVWILQDACPSQSINASDSQIAIDLLGQYHANFLVYHASPPLCFGAIWNTIHQGLPIPGEERDPESTIVVISAESLRAEGLELSNGLSWERTCEDFIQQLGSIGELVTLTTCAHLVVVFGCDGVIYHRGRRAAHPVLLFDPQRSEGDFVRWHHGPIPGLTEAFVAGLAAGLAAGLVRSTQADVLDSIELGLCVMRRLARRGLTVSPSAQPTYSACELLREVEHSEQQELVQFSIPSDDIARGDDGRWSILEYSIGDVSELARQVVREGSQVVATSIPHVKFNQLILSDRRDIEPFRSLFHGITHYLATPSIRKPFGVAVCGSRGAGKTFATLQVIKSAAASQSVQSFRCDMSEVTSMDDLGVIFQSVRDCSLEGDIPIVHFHNTGSLLSGSTAGWLPYLLKPLREGCFMDRGVNRPMGRGVLFFEDAHWESLADLQCLEKGGASDFLSSLNASVSLLGPDQMDSGQGVDTLYSMRRAFILRSLLEEQIPGLKSSSRLDIDDRILNGLLLVPRFRRGVHSIKAIVEMSHISRQDGFRPSDLPQPSQLGFHVQHDTLIHYMKGPVLPAQIREKAAQLLHEAYLRERTRTASPGELEQLNLQSWVLLDEEFKESARAHVDSIPNKLRLISCFLAQRRDSRTAVREFTPGQLEKMSIVEHNRWNSERLQKQWRKGERNPNIRSTPLLIPWADLEEKFRNIDRALVASYPSILPESYAIYPIGGN